MLILALSGCSYNKAIVLYEKNKENSESFAILQLPVEVDIIYYDGEKRYYMPAYQPLITYHIATGEQTIGFRYEDVFTAFDGEDYVVKSKEVFLTFTAEKDQRYTINFKPPRLLSEAEITADQFEFDLYHKTRHIAKTVKQPNFIFAGFGSLFSKNENTPTSNQLSSQELPYLKQLKTIWQKSTEDDKKAFFHWVENYRVKEDSEEEW